ncbi:MAG: hypothetical protein FJW96_02135 [Actinobacteria bacterium]|nr:hypothetical protein [Actinomycetota bacterium]
MDEDARERAAERIAEARHGRFEAARLEAALERSRARIDALAAAAEELEQGLPDRVGDAVQEGLKREMQAAGKNLAEIRGLLNRTIRRLEAIEQELVAERNARIDDLEVLVDLVSSGWAGVDERLRRIEERGSHASGAIVPLLPLAEPVDALAS